MEFLPLDKPQHQLNAELAVRLYEALAHTNGIGPRHELIAQAQYLATMAVYELMLEQGRSRV